MSLRFGLWPCLGFALTATGCGSMYSYYGSADAATLKTNGKLTAMDSDTRTREAGVFYIEPGTRVIGLRGKANSSRQRVLLLDVAPHTRYRVDIQGDGASNSNWSVDAKGKAPTPVYRWCDAQLACKVNEPFDHCVRRTCP
ncbi:MAG: hypothetical protein ACR2PZ_02565 [Pseudomonadales bacterium]